MSWRAVPMCLERETANFLGAFQALIKEQQRRLKSL